MFAWRALPAARGGASRRSGPDGEISPGAYLTMPALHSAGIGVAFTTRHGGVSAAPFGSLNLSLVSGDDPEVVMANRRRALGAVGATLDRWVSARQVHGAGVERVGSAERGRGAESAETTVADTDALWTDEPGVALVILTADCVPVLLVDPDRRRIAAVHAGWRGLVAGVIEAAVSAMGGASLALLGPSIGPCCYEVGDDVAEPAADAFGPEVVRGNGRAHVDLWRAATLASRRCGVPDVRVAALCTRCEPHRFYSHRASDAGRQGLLATIAPKAGR